MLRIPTDWRLWRRERATFAVLVATISLGAAAAATATELVVRVYWSPSRLIDSRTIVRIESVESQRGAASDNTAPDVLAIRDAVPSLAHLTGFLTTDYNLTVDATAIPISVTFASAQLWQLAAVRPVMGTTYGPAHDVPGGDVRKVVLSHALWSSAFAADPGIVGATILLGKAPYEVLGVMPAGFVFPDRADAWVPLEAWFAYLGTSSARVSRGGRAYGAVARVGESTSRSVAQVELDVVAGRLEREFPASNRGVRFVARPLTARAAARARPFLIGAGCAGLLLWLTSLAAAGSLLRLVRLRHRADTETRCALGASPGQLRRETLRAAAPLAALSMLFGVILALILLAAIEAFVPPPRPVWLGGLPGAVALIWLGGLVLLPAALHTCAAGRDGQRTNATIGSRADRQHRLPFVLPSAQIAMAVALVVIGLSGLDAGRQLRRIDPGFHAPGAVGIFVSPPGDAVVPLERRASYARFYDAVLERLRADPSIAAAGAVNALPLLSRTGFQRSTFTVRGQTPEEQAGNPVLNVLRASSGYFDAMGIPRLAGRDFDSSDQATSTRVAVVSRALAARIAPGASAIGTVMKLGAHGSSSPWATVIGVVGDVRQDSLKHPGGADIYFSYRQVIAGEVHFVVRSTTGEQHAIEAVEHAIRLEDPQIAVFARRTLTTLIADSLWQERLAGAAATTLGATAILMAVISVVGVIGAWLSARRREFAVRVALGASPLALVGLVLHATLRIVMPGLAGCLVLTAAGTALIRALVVHAMPFAPSVGLAIACVVAVVAVAAAVPAVAAVYQDPVRALRDGH